MISDNPIKEHRRTTRDLALLLNKNDVFDWLIENGYFPESYVLPPCFSVVKRPTKQKLYYRVNPSGNKYKVNRTECINVHYPKTELTDRQFGIIHPKIHNDIAFHIANNWGVIVDAILPETSCVSPYAFPIPIDAKNPGRLSYLRSGRMIYEFIEMTETDIASVAYKYSYIVKTDIKSFYPSIYTHSIAWALHGKDFIRKKDNLRNYNLLGNRLDRLFQNANDGCTNGVPIGPVVSDIVAEIVASGIDKILSRSIHNEKIKCEVVRFKDDYKILVKSEEDGRSIIKLLQAALKEYSLELNEEKTTINKLPAGLFREWVSKYHAAQPFKPNKYSWKQFSELYLSVIHIDHVCPGTGVIDRFLADLVDRKCALKFSYSDVNLQKVISMLIMLATLRVKAFPKIIAILEAILKRPFGNKHQKIIVEYLDKYLEELSRNEERNKYLISWVCYFLVSNDLLRLVSSKPKLNDPITRSIIKNRGYLFKDFKDYKLFVGCKAAGAKLTMLEYLDIFNPPADT